MKKSIIQSRAQAVQGVAQIGARKVAVMSAAVLILATVGLTSGCSTTSPDVIKPGDAQRMSQVEDAVVLSVRPVVVEGSQSGLGGAAGAAMGGISGAGASGGPRGSAVIGIAGAIVGGVVGNAVERYGTREEAIEILLQLPNGTRRAIVQAKGKEDFNPGDSVILVTTGGKTRVMLAPKVSAPAAP